ncbi:MAG TPA: DUF72 domain-containing protein [Terriglobales bacterium]|jgi:uncharacterized protein YecE (DUF72 family)
MKNVYIGTSGWAYPSWKPGFYPPKTASAKFLEYYASQLNCVEVNYTFRARAAESTLQKWADAVPDGFRFGFKAHQRITHIKRLKDVGDDVASFCASLQPVIEAHKLGPILFQLPPNLKKNAELLQDFLRSVPKKAQIAIEYRHESWFDDAVYALMREHDVALCVAESDELQVPEVHTASFGYFRFRMSDHSEEKIASLESRVAEAAKEREVYAFLKHEETPAGALSARVILEHLQSAKV